MSGAFDFGAVALYMVFGGTLVFLVLCLFDIQKMFSTVRTQVYLSGYPELDPSEGLLEVNKDKVCFKDVEAGEEIFSIPLSRIESVRTGHKEISSSNKVVNRIAGLLDERRYLFIELQDKDRRHKLEFSAHHASSVNEDIREKILQAKNTI